MKKGIFCILISCSLLLVDGCTEINDFDKPVQTVAAINPDRYPGTWYEIASVPILTPKNCYCPQISFTNFPTYTHAKLSCRKDNPTGQQITRILHAEFVPNSHYTKAKISFNWLIKYDYWVLHMEDNYQYAITSTPNRKYYWIYARQPQISKVKYDELLAIALRQGYSEKYLKQSLQCLDGKLVPSVIS